MGEIRIIQPIYNYKKEVKKMHAEKLNFSRIFQIEGTIEHYHIPKYQRQYTWKQENWETLLNDITENEMGYFIGSIIIVNDVSDTRPNIEKVYQVVDGQQRLTTLSILQGAIYKKYTELQKNDDLSESAKEDLMVKVSNLRKKIIKIKEKQYEKEFGGFEYGNNEVAFLRVQPSTQDSNLDDYKFLLCHIGILKNIPQPKYFKRKQFSKAFTFFYDNIPDTKSELDKLSERINSLNFIHISVGSQADAFTLFETLNNRGVPLSPIDIIKNSLLSEMEKHFQQPVDISYNQWQKLLNFIPDFDNQIRFLRQFYNAFKTDEWVKHERYTVATRTNIIHIYERMIKKEAKRIFKDLLEKGNIYGLLINTVIEIEDFDEIITEKFIPSQKFISSVIELNHVGASSSYTLLLFLITNYKNLENEHTIVEIIDFLIKYYVRRNVTDTPNTRDLDAININIIENCIELISDGDKIKSKHIIDWHCQNSRALPSTNQQFIDALSDKVYDNNVGMTRYLLWKLDSVNHTREYAPNLWERNHNNIYIWTIEHILPEGKNLGEEWINMIADGDRETASNLQDEWMHKLGNLTLSAYNSNLSNRPFEDKKSLSDKKVGIVELKIGYKNGLALNNISFNYQDGVVSLSTIDKWDVEAIESRTILMVSKCIEIFKFE